MISITAVLMRLTCSCVLLTVASAQESSMSVVWAVRFEWKRLLIKHNNANISTTVSLTVHKGLRERKGEELTVSQTHSAAVGLEANLPFKLLNVSANLQYSHSNTKERKTMLENEIYSYKVISWTAIIPPKSRIAVWQLVVDVGGNNVDFDYIYTAEDENEVPVVLNATAGVKLLRGGKIRNGTPFRIKHKSSGRFLSVTTRRNWLAAYLRHNPDFYFSISSCDYCRKIRIYTLNSTGNGYIYMYASSPGNIYFDIYRSDHDEQKWFVNKPWPLYIGDVVSLSNAYWPTAGLCAPNGYTYAACLYDNDDEWILY